MTSKPAPQPPNAAYDDEVIKAREHAAPQAQGMPEEL